LRNYRNQITVPTDAVIHLADDEKEEVDRWVNGVGLRSREKVVLFECASKSGQSSMTPEHAVMIAKQVIAERPNTCFVLSTHLPVSTDDERIIHGGTIGIRQTAYLSHYADLFVGCASGISVAVTSPAAKPNLPNIQILSAATSVYASFRHECEYFGKPYEQFLEMTSEDGAKVARAIIAVLDEGIAAAKLQYDEYIPVAFDHYFQAVKYRLLKFHRYSDAAQSLLVTLQRYGPQPDLLRFGREEILPYLNGAASRHSLARQLAIS
jgi:hypothetical protein